jgi:transcriptional regulator with XRE-family HTH domain
VRPDAVKSAVLLRQARLRAGLSQQALADRSGVHRVQINRYEAGAMAPSFDTVIDLVRACGFDLSLELTELDGGGDDTVGERLALGVAERVQRTLELGARADRSAVFDPIAILAALESGAIDYVLIGGIAQAVRGVQLATAGVDICPSFAGENLERLSDAVAELGPRRKGVAVTEQTLDANAVLRINTAAGRLSIVGSPAGVPNGYVDLRRAASREDLGGGLRPLVAGTRDLAAMAAALHRRADTERLPMLRRIVELEVDLVPVTPAPSPARRNARRRASRMGPRIGP